MSSDEATLAQVDALMRAVERADEHRTMAAVERLVASVREADAATVQLAVDRMVPMIASMSVDAGADVMPVVATYVRRAEDPAAAMAVWSSRLVTVLGQAAAFEQQHRRAFGHVPDPQDLRLVVPVFERFVEHAPKRGVPQHAAFAMLQAWFSVQAWSRAFGHVLQSDAARRAVPDSATLIVAAAPLCAQFPSVYWVHYVLETGGFPD